MFKTKYRVLEQSDSYYVCEYKFWCSFGWREMGLFWGNRHLFLSGAEKYILKHSGIKEEPKPNNKTVVWEYED